MSVWGSGPPYEAYVGRWSRLVATEFLLWLDVPSGKRWLDLGCGTGALAESILAVASPSEVVGADASEGFIAHAREHVTDARASFRVADAQALPFEDGQDAGFDAVVSGLMLNFLPSSERGVSEMVRVARPGGTVAAYVWDYAGEMQLMRHFWDAAAAIDPNARDLDEGLRFPICQPEPLERSFRGAGLKDVAVRQIDVQTMFRDFDDYWLPFLGAQGPAPSYAMSLSESHRAALRERIRAGLPVGADGSIHLIARAWAVRGAVKSA